MSSAGEVGGAAGAGAGPGVTTMGGSVWVGALGKLGALGEGSGI